MLTKKNKSNLRDLAHKINMSLEYTLKFQMSEEEFVDEYGKESFIHLRQIGLVMVVDRELHVVRFNKDTECEEVVIEVGRLKVEK